MDWIRRNWPDLIIGFALLAVIAGIIATLLSGGSFFPFGNAGPNSGTQPTVTSPQVGQASPSATVTDTTPAVTEVLPPGPPVIAETPDTTETTETATPDTVTVVSPEVTEQVPNTVESGTSESVTPLAPGTSAVNPASTTEASATTQTTFESGEASTLFPESPYRISVGSYRDASNAERRAESFSSAGYPVFIGQQDDLSIVLVGPYGNRADAEAAVATIQRDGLEAAPLLFELADEPGEAASVVEAGTSTPSNASAAEAVTNAAGNATTQAEAASASGLRGNYIQAGAYDSSEGARPQRERLEGFGFAVAEVKEGSFIKLLVGPFNESDLDSAQARLNAQGVEHFVRSF